MGEITREQVELAIGKPQEIDYRELGADWYSTALVDGHPCEGGTCQQGECVPRRGTGYPDHGPACADGEVCE